MKLVICGVAHSREELLKVFFSQYIDKIRRFITVDLELIKPKNFDRNHKDHKKDTESSLLLQKIDNRDFLILCDERGENFSSQGFSARLDKILTLGHSRIVLAIGGAYGFTQEARDRANLIWSFSPMTMSHHLSYGVALEQIYRAFTIIKGMPYHND